VLKEVYLLRWDIEWDGSQVHFSVRICARYDEEQTYQPNNTNAVDQTVFVITSPACIHRLSHQQWKLIVSRFLKWSLKISSWSHTHKCFATLPCEVWTSENWRALVLNTLDKLKPLNLINGVIGIFTGNMQPPWRLTIMNAEFHGQLFSAGLQNHRNKKVVKQIEKLV